MRDRDSQFKLLYIIRRKDDKKYSKEKQGGEKEKEGDEKDRIYNLMADESPVVPMNRRIMMACEFMSLIAIAVFAIIEVLPLCTCGFITPYSFLSRLSFCDRSLPSPPPLTRSLVIIQCTHVPERP